MDGFGPHIVVKRVRIGRTSGGTGLPYGTYHPHLGDLEWVEGTFPTPYGVIEIRHEKGADGKVISYINAPEEIRVCMD